MPVNTTTEGPIAEGHIETYEEMLKVVHDQCELMPEDMTVAEIAEAILSKIRTVVTTDLEKECRSLSGQFGLRKMVFNITNWHRCNKEVNRLIEARIAIPGTVISVERDYYLVEITFGCLCNKRVQIMRSCDLSSKVGEKLDIVLTKQCQYIRGGPESRFTLPYGRLAGEFVKSN